ncbi:MAG: hypothetical protein Q4A55_03110 [Aerococcus sp.]|nr:hypothetical protein [Aerococcus sp.]
MKKKLFSITVLVITCLFTFLLGGCGNGDIKKSHEPVPASKAFKQSGLWLKSYSSSLMDKKDEVTEVLSFDGKGNVTIYQCKDESDTDQKAPTFADLNGLSDEDIIKLAKEKDKALFDTKRKKALDTTSQAINTLQSAYDKLKKEYNDRTYTSDTLHKTEEEEEPKPSGDPQMDAAVKGVRELNKEFYEHMRKQREDMAKENYEKAFADLEKHLNEAKKEQEKTKTAEYKEPKAEPYKLHITTDSSGNSTQSEEFIKTIPHYSFYQASVDKDLSTEDIITAGVDGTFTPAEENTKELDFELLPMEHQKIYDTIFGGFSQLVTSVDVKQGGFELDTPKTEGVEVD